MERGRIRWSSLAKRRNWRWAIAGGVFSLLGACSTSTDKPHLAPPDRLALDLAQAQAMVTGPVLPDRFEVVALADRLAVGAVQAPAQGARLAELAARLRLRLFRTRHGEGDGREAAALLERAAEGEGGCERWLERARLLGELARDPVVTAREAAPAMTRWPDPGCQARTDALLEEIGPYVARSGARRSAAVAAAAATGSAAAAEPEQVVASPEAAALGPAVLQAIESYGDKESARIVLRLNHAAAFEVGGGSGRQGWGGLPRVRRSGPHPSGQSQA